VYVILKPIKPNYNTVFLTYLHTTYVSFIPYMQSTHCPPPHPTYTPKHTHTHTHKHTQDDQGGFGGKYRRILLEPGTRNEMGIIGV
jgi:hypothetical protein